MWTVDLPPTLLVGYDERVEEFLKEFMNTIPTIRDNVLHLPYKPKVHEVLNVSVMSPFVRLPLSHVLDVLDPFNVEAIAERFKVVLILTDEPITLSTGLLLKDLGVEVLALKDREAVDVEELVDKRPKGQRIPRVINGLYVIPGHGKPVLSEKFKRFEDGFITETGCVVAVSKEAAERILSEQYA